MRRQTGIDDQHDWRGRKQRDGSKVLRRIEWKLAVKGLIDGERPGSSEQERVAVGLRFGYEIAAGITAAAGAVLDDDLLAESLRELLCQNSCHDVDRSARRIGIDYANDAIRIVLRGCVNSGHEQ